MRSMAVCLSVAGLLAAGSGRAADDEEIQGLLGREVVGPALPLVEIQRFCEKRVPKLGQFDSPEAWQKEADRLRAAVLARVVYRGQAVRWRDAETKVEWLETIEGGPGYRIKKLRYEALPGLWIPALLYEPEKLSGKVPAVLNVNGHTHLGKQYPPKQLRCINQAKRGMLAMNLEWLGMGQLRGEGYTHYRMNQIDLCGTSGLAPFYLAMKRGLDVLVDHENTDPKRVAVTGLSGGGWQTIFLSSLDMRVKLADPVAGYSSFLTRARHLKDLGDSEQTPNDLATLVDYTHLTAMMAPRPLLLTYNAKDDCCFESGYALEPLLDAARPLYKLYGKPGALRSHVNEDPGTHNYEIDNRQALYGMLGDSFYPGDKTFNAEEIPSKEEVKSEEQLHVELPEKNEDFHTLALALSEGLPRQPELPGETEAAIRWQESRRGRLREIVQAHDYKVHAIESFREKADGLTAVGWKLQMDSDWSVPVVELVQGEPKKTAILVADEGRKNAGRAAAKLLETGYRVLAVDPANLGESTVSKKAMLFSLLVAAVGERPLGIQASQLAAVARWSTGNDGAGPVLVVAHGPRASIAALVAAALERKGIGEVELHGSLGSLKEVIERNWGVGTAPELFCFGLLEAMDVKHLAALAAPRPVRFVEPAERVKAEMAGLGSWYRTLGVEFDPLQQPD